MGESIFTDQSESYMQQVEFFEYLPDIGKGVTGSLCRHFEIWGNYRHKSVHIYLDIDKNGYVVPFATVPPIYENEK